MKKKGKHHSKTYASNLVKCHVNDIETQENLLSVEIFVCVSCEDHVLIFRLRSSFASTAMKTIEISMISSV